MKRGLPFPVVIPEDVPNKTTIQAFNDAKNNTNMTTYESAEALLKDLGI